MSGGLLVLMTGSAYLAARAARGRAKSDHNTTSILTNSLFALLGLILAFMFTAAYTRFEHRRTLLSQEINAIGTLHLRLDLLKPNEQPELREKLRRYTLARAAIYPSAAGSVDEQTALDQAAALQGEIWRRVVELTSSPDDRASRLLLIPALNEMIDITSTRGVARDDHTPGLVIVVLFLLAMAATAILVWNVCVRGGQVPRLHLAVFVLVTAAVVFVTLDLEYPRFGFARLDDVNARLVALAATMK